MDTVKELLMNAEIAFSNKQYDVALEWYRKVLEITPDDLYALSRAGALCVPLGKFEDAKVYFGRARDLDPENGDNAFNYGNACFFNNDKVKAFELYVEAEKVGCSDDVKPRLYYQMALLCSMNEDIKSSLIYFQKCEESDKTGKVALNPDMISEKLKLYMIQQDYENAEKCAAQLVALNPGEFRGYMVYFSLLMAHKLYEKAEEVLRDAARYAELSDEDRFALTLQMAALLLTKGDNDGAIRVLEDRKNEGDLTNAQLSDLLLALAEAQTKNEKYDEAIDILNALLTGKAFLPAETGGEDTGSLGKLTEAELNSMRKKEAEILHEKIKRGLISSKLGAEAEVRYDSDGKPYRKYKKLANLFGKPEDEKSTDVEISDAEIGYDLPVETREKVIFTLLSCQLAKDDYQEAQKQAEVLKHSENKYYNYFGVYTAAMCGRKLNGATAAVEKKYEEAIAFFRNKTLADVTDTLACLFRARLYAEQGKYEKADEIAYLLAEADRDAVKAYIESCKA